MAKRGAQPRRGRARRRGREGRRPRLCRGGFSLTEILVVLVILTIGIVPLSLVQSRARRDVTTSDHYTQAIALAQSRFEQMKGAGFGAAAADSGQAGQLRWTQTVQNVSFGLDRIGVTVTWFDGRSNQTVQMVGMVSMR